MAVNASSCCCARCAVLAAVTEPETESEIGAVGTGEQPAVAGETSSGLLVPQRRSRAGRRRPRCIRAPQTPTTPALDRQGRAVPRRRAGRTVGTDDEVGLRSNPPPSSATRPSSTEATRRGDVDRARVQRRSAQISARNGTRHDDRVTRIRPTGLVRQQHSPTARARHDHVAHRLVPSTVRPRSSSRRTPRGPIRSPQPCRGRPSLVDQADPGACPRKVNAATLPAGPAPTTIRRNLLCDTDTHPDNSWSVRCP